MGCCLSGSSRYQDHDEPGAVADSEVLRVGAGDGAASSASTAPAQSTPERALEVPKPAAAGSGIPLQPVQLAPHSEQHEEVGTTALPVRPPPAAEQGRRGPSSEQEPHGPPARAAAAAEPSPALSPRGTGEEPVALTPEALLQEDAHDDSLPSFVIAWGTNDCGQCMLGPEAPECCPRPLLVESLQKRLVRHVFAGYDYSSVVTGTQRLYAAGSNRGRFLSEEDSGGSPTSGGPCLRLPQHVGFDELEAFRFVAVSGGRDHLVAVTDAGAAISWGRSNEFGQLGRGRSGLQRALPAVVAGLPAGYQVVAVTCGEFSTLALISSGELYAWGANDLGQLGVGDTEPRPAPTRLTGSASGVPFRAVSAGHQHGLALSRSGKVYAWGNSRHGRLGLGEQSEASSACAPSPRVIEGLPCVKHISAGGAHSAVLAHSSRLLTAGDNRWGQLGIRRSQATQTSRFLEPDGFEDGMRVVECGAHHTLCLTLMGLVVGFGCNKEGQLGTGAVSDCEDVPVRVPVEQGVGRQLLIYALAVTTDHSCVLAAPAPDRREHLALHLAAGGRVLATRATAVVDLVEDEEYKGSGANAAAGATGSDVSDGGEAPEGNDEEEGLRGCSSPLVRVHSYVRFRLPAVDEEGEVVLLTPLVQPGVASREFAALSAADLLLLVRAAQASGEWREVRRSLGAVLRRPSVLNASFHFPSLQEPRLAAEELHEALELTAAAPATFRDDILEAAAKGLEEYCAPAARKALRTRECLRGAIAYLLLPQLRAADTPQAPRHKVLVQVALLVASLSAAERREVVGLFVDELPQASILREAVVPAVRGFLNERVKACHASQSMSDPGLWNATVLMQVLFVANEQLREQQRRQLFAHGASQATLAHRFLRHSEFQMSALDEETITPRAAYDQLVHALGVEVRNGAAMSNPAELLFDEQWAFQESTQTLPPRVCVLMVHRNLIPVAFKQKVLQVSNTIKQHSLQETLLGPAQILALLAGHDARPFFQLSVRRQNIVEDTVTKLRVADPRSMRFPLRVKFEGEEGLDEGGVRREFFQVLIRQLFDEAYAMFVCNNDSHTAWFNMAALDTADTDAMYRVCGIVMGLAVYNNEDGIQIHFPLALFKKLKGEKCNLADLEDVEPKVWLSLQQLLAWTPKTKDPNKEFEDTFCMTFATNYDFFGEARTVELKPGGEEIPVNFENRSEYVDLHCSWLLDRSVERQFKHLAEGFSLVVDSSLWSLLTAEEAHLILCTDPELDIDDLRRGARFDGYTGSEAYIDDFWEILREFDLSQRKRFLAFVTGCDRAPLGGLHELRLAVQKSGEEPTDRLPTAHTCFKLLELPHYCIKDKLRKKLLTAIENSEGFGLE